MDGRQGGMTGRLVEGGTSKAIDSVLSSIVTKVDEALFQSIFNICINTNQPSLYNCSNAKLIRNLDPSLELRKRLQPPSFKPSRKSRNHNYGKSKGAALSKQRLSSLVDSESLEDACSTRDACPIQTKLN